MMYIIIDREYLKTALCDSYELKEGEFGEDLYAKNLLIIKGRTFLKKGTYYKQSYFGKVENCTILKVNHKIAKILYG